MAEIVFSNSFPKVFRPPIESMTREVEWVLPAWLQRVYITYDADESEAAAYLTPEKDYRFVRLTICPRFFEMPDTIQRENIIHEFVHASFAPVKHYAMEMIEILCVDNESNKLLEIIRKELTSRDEAATQDLAYSISKFSCNAPAK